MRKIIIFQKRRVGSDRHAFFDWSLREQPLLIERIPGLRRCVVSLEADGKDESFDAATELCFDDAHAAVIGLGGREGEQALAAMRLQVARMERVDVVEHKFVDTGLPSRFKLMAALKRRPDLTRADFRAWWLDKHAPLVTVFSELRRYQVDIVEDGAEQFVDGIAEVSFADLATLRRIMSRADVKEVQEDSQVHTQARYRMFVEEHPVPA